MTHEQAPQRIPSAKADRAGQGLTPSAGLLGRTVRVTVDRPLGSAHPRHPETIYPVNYGYVAGVTGGDGQPQDAYLLGVPTPLPRGATVSGQLIGVIHRLDDMEDKWVVAPPGLMYHQAQIWEQVQFQEQYFRSQLTAQYQRSCGVIPYRVTPRGVEYLVLLQQGSRTWSFPKGHMDPFETERQTAARELREEIGQQCRLRPGFRRTLSYSLGGQRSKTVVLFLGQLTRPPRLQPTEIVRARLVPREEALRLLRHGAYRDILAQAERIIGDAPPTPWDGGVDTVFEAKPTP